jgi:DNA-binding MarR family transcriptional regulator
MTPEAQNEDMQVLARIDRAVHEPARLMILAYLSAVESADFLFIANQTGLTRGNLSSHMTRLEQAGYVSIKKEFVDRIPRTLLRITRQGRAALRNYRKNMMQVLKELPG